MKKCVLVFILTFLSFSFLNGKNPENWVSNPLLSTSFQKNENLIEKAFPEIKSNVFYFTESEGYLILFCEKEIIYFNPMKREIELKISWDYDLTKKQNPETSLPEAKKYFYSGKNFQNIEAKAYACLSYKNIFQGIHLNLKLKEGKLKYEWKVSNGNEYKKISMYYSGCKTIQTDQEGNLNYFTPSGKFIETKPISFYNNKQIESRFIVSGNKIQFQVIDKINNKELIIDPWISSPVLAKPQIFEVDYDNYKNVVVQGSCGTYKIVHLNPNGTTNWTHTSSFGIIPYNGVEVPGGLTVIRPSGTVIISEGITAYNATSPARVRKLSASGQIISTVPIDSNIIGISRIEYIESSNKILMGSYNADSITVGQTLLTDTNLTITQGPVDVLGINEAWHAVTLMAVDKSGSFAYILTAKTSPSTNIFLFPLDTTVDNDIYKISLLGMSPPIFQSETYYDFNSAGNQPFTVTSNFAWGSITSFTDFFHGIALGNQNDLFVFDGKWVKKMNTSNGQLVDSIQINPKVRRCSGISSDGCDNLFVAATKSIKKYSSNLVLKDSILMQDTIYDILHDGKCTLYACGRSFVACLDAAPEYQPIITISDPSNCYSCNGSIDVQSSLPCSDGPTLSYVWQNNPNQNGNSINNVCPDEIITLQTWYCNVSEVDTFILNYTTPFNFEIQVSPDSIHTCKGTPITIHANQAESFEFIPSNGITAINDSTFEYDGNLNTQITVVGTTVACADTQSIQIYVDPVPNAILNLNPQSTIVPAAILVNNNSQNAISFNWYGIHSSLANDTSFSILENTPGNYSLELVAINEFGCTDTATQNYTIELIIDAIAPNFFSPNGDQLNDLFTLKTKGLKNVKLTIYDRWGDLVYLNESQSPNWNGINRFGKKSEDGTYYFILEGVAFNDTKFTKNGFFQLLK